MKIGDYVRTKNGIIGKVVKEETFMNDINIFLDNNKGNITLSTKDGMFKVNRKKDIIKSSPNIIDLIEVGDYVNGSKVLDVTIYGVYIEDGTTYGNTYIEEKDIKSILTKEQFEQMVYKVGE